MTFADLDRERDAGIPRTFLGLLSPKTRERMEGVLARGPLDPLKTSQSDLDEMTDGERWDWLEATCRRETELRQEAEAAAAQTQMGDTIGAA